MAWSAKADRICPGRAAGRNRFRPPRNIETVPDGALLAPDEHAGVIYRIG